MVSRKKYKRKFKKTEGSFCERCGKKMVLSISFTPEKFSKMDGKLLGLMIKIVKTCPTYYHGMTSLPVHPVVRMEQRVPKKYWKTMARLFNLDQSKMQ